MKRLSSGIIAPDLGDLIDIGVRFDIAAVSQYQLREACVKFGITTQRSICAFIAQCCVESDYFQQLEENLNYTTPERILKVFPSRVKSLAQAQKLVRNPEALANTVYGGRFGNGDYDSGDGWSYRGSGIMQLTFKSNFESASKATGIDYVAEPDLMRTPEYAIAPAASFFKTNGCIALADKGDIDAVTKKVNPAMLHASKRKDVYNKLMQFTVRNDL